MKKEDLKKGTRVFYGGDMANDEGLGVIMEQITDKWGTHVNIKMDDGRDINALSIAMFSDEYKGHGGTRFVTEKAYKDFRQVEIDKVKATLAKVKEGKHIPLKHITYSDANDYCLRENGVTLPEKLEQVQQEWLDKLEETIIDEKEVEAIMKAKEDVGITDLIPKPGDKIEVTEVVEIPKVELTKDEMKQRVIDWVEKIKADQVELNKELDLGDKFDTDYDSICQIREVVEEEANKDLKEEFLFLFDGELYEYIEHYRSDGMHKRYGKLFDALTEGTNWIQESDRPGVEYFVEEK